MEIRIRTMVPGDYRDLVQFLQDLHRSHFEARPDIFREEASVPSEELFLRDLQDRYRLFLCAETAETVVGFCDAALQAIPADPSYPLVPVVTAHINDLYVLPEYRRLGIATALFRETERRCREAGAEKISLMAWSFNEDALALYGKLGMETVFQQMERKL